MTLFNPSPVHNLLESFVRDLLAATDRSGDQLTNTVHELFSVNFESGLFNRAFPGFNQMQGCDQGSIKHLEGDVLTHSREFLLAVTKKIASGNNESLKDRENKELAILHALIHDIEKPSTRQEYGGGRVEFPGHEEKAADRIAEMMKGLGYRKDFSFRLEWLVRTHGLFYGIRDLPEQQRRDLYKNADFELALTLYECDCEAFWLTADGTERRAPDTHWISNDRAGILDG